MHISPLTWIKYSINAKMLALGMAVNIYTDYLMFYPSRQHEMESFQVQVYIHQWFHDEQELNLCKT